jgi:hypothetical protein
MMELVSTRLRRNGVCHEHEMDEIRPTKPHMRLATIPDT